MPRAPEGRFASVDLDESMRVVDGVRATATAAWTAARSCPTTACSGEAARRRWGWALGRRWVRRWAAARR